MAHEGKHNHMRKGGLVLLMIAGSAVAWGQASLSTDVTRLDFAYSGSTPPGPKTLGIRNIGTGSMPWTLTSSVSWLVLGQSSGQGNANVEVRPSVIGMAAGSYSGFLTVTAPGAANSPRRINVSLAIPSPGLGLSSKTLRLTATAGGPTVTGTLAISNTGGGQMPWSVSSISPSWLTVTPSAGDGNGSLTVQANPATLRVGLQVATFVVTAPGAWGSPAYIRVEVNVTAAAVQVSVFSPSSTVPSSGSSQFTATVTGTANTGVAWSATAGSISNSGLFTAPAVTVPTEVTVTARSIQDPTKTASKTIAVMPVVQVSVGSPASSVSAGGTMQFTATVTGTANTDVTWSASAGSINDAGLFTAPLSDVSMTITITARSLADATVAGSRQVTVIPVEGAVFLMSGGLVTAEAEHAVAVNRAASWAFRDTQAGFSGAGYMASEPNHGVSFTSDYSAQAPELRFQVYFNSPGVYYVWARGYAPSAADRSLHFGLNGQPAAAAQGLGGFPLLPSAWGWSSTPAGSMDRILLQIPNPGLHTVHVWMGDDGVLLDKLLLTDAAEYVPTGLGPVASNHIGALPLRGIPPGAPRLQLSTGTLQFRGVAGAELPAQSVGISTGSTAVAWTVTANTHWLHISPRTGTGAGALTISVAPGSLGAGIWQGQLHVDAGVAGTSSIIATLELTPPPVQVSGNFYVSPTASEAGDGSSSNPWTLARALSHPPEVKPGDTIWVRGGTYNGTFTSRLKGTPDKPIIVRAAPGERATIDTGARTGTAGLHALGSDTWFWGLEIMSSNPNRLSRQPGSFGIADRVDGVGAFGPRLRFINMIVHDTAQAFGFWSAAPDSEIYGSLMYYNGWAGADRGHGHGVYAQNQTGVKVIEDNIHFSGFGQGLRVYGTENSFGRNIRFTGNVAFNSGEMFAGPQGHWSNYLVTVGSGAEGIVFENNHSYHNPGSSGSAMLGWQFSGVEKDAQVRNNYFVGGSQAVDVWNWERLTFTGNTIYTEERHSLLALVNRTVPASTWEFDNNRYFGRNLLRFNGANTTWASWSAVTGMDQNSAFTPGRPSGVWTFVRPNRYEPGRANIVIYNWDALTHVAVDVTAVLTPGQSYEVRDAQNYFGPPVASGVFQGGHLLLPMTGLSVAAPVGDNIPYIPRHTPPQFGVFVLLPR